MMDNKINLFSDNLVFFDSEFSSLDPYKGEILSLALVKMNGEELYLELEYDGEVSPWVKEHIIPTLNQKKVSRKEGIDIISKFMIKDKSFIISYVNQQEMTFFYKFYKDLENCNRNDKYPFNWIPIDFATILFSCNINPSILFEDRESFLSLLGIDHLKYNQHNALDDVRLLREVYLKMFKQC